LRLPAPNGTSTGILPDWSAGTLIPVDPYYLVHRARGARAYHPQVILAGRAINDSMPAHVAGMMIRGLNDAGKVIKGSKVLIDFFTKNRVKTALRVGFRLFLRPKAQQKGVTVFDQTFVKSLRVKTALRVGLRFLAGMRLRGLV
jgi:hypothetical protein